MVSSPSLVTGAPAELLPVRADAGRPPAVGRAAAAAGAGSGLAFASRVLQEFPSPDQDLRREEKKKKLFTRDTARNYRAKLTSGLGERQDPARSRGTRKTSSAPGRRRPRPGPPARPALPTAAAAAAGPGRGDTNAAGRWDLGRARPPPPPPRRPRSRAAGLLSRQRLPRPSPRRRPGPRGRAGRRSGRPSFRPARPAFPTCPRLPLPVSRRRASAPSSSFFPGCAAPPGSAGEGAAAASPHELAGPPQGQRLRPAPPRHIHSSERARGGEGSGAGGRGLAEGGAASQAPRRRPRPGAGGGEEAARGGWGRGGLPRGRPHRPRPARGARARHGRGGGAAHVGGGSGGRGRRGSARGARPEPPSPAGATPEPPQEGGGLGPRTPRARPGVAEPAGPGAGQEFLCASAAGARRPGRPRRRLQGSPPRSPASSPGARGGPLPTPARLRAPAPRAAGVLRAPASPGRASRQSRRWEGEDGPRNRLEVEPLLEETGAALRRRRGLPAPAVPAGPSLRGAGPRRSAWQRRRLLQGLDASCQHIWQSAPQP